MDDNDGTMMANDGNSDGKNDDDNIGARKVEIKMWYSMRTEFSPMRNDNDTLDSYCHSRVRKTCNPSLSVSKRKKKQINNNMYKIIMAFRHISIKHYALS